MEYSNFIVIFILLQIVAKCRSAPGVKWITEELPAIQIPDDVKSQDSETPLQSKIRPLLKITEEMKDDIEDTYADEPNIPGIPCGDGSREVVKAQYRDHYVKKLEEFMRLAGRNPPPAPNGKTIQEQQMETLASILMKAEERKLSYTYQPKIKSVYPICNGSNTEKDKMAQNISILFDPDDLDPPSNVYLNVISATMNIYKVGYQNVTTPRNKSIAVSLSCLKATKKNSPNSTKTGRKLGAVQTIAADEERWMQWNITKWVQEWFNGSSYGSTLMKYWITIKVAADQEHLPAFFTINCSKITAVNGGNKDGHSVTSVDKEIPYINVTIREIPKRDIDFNNKEQKLLNGVMALKRNISAGSDASSSSERKTKDSRKNKQWEEGTDTSDQPDTST